MKRDFKITEHYLIPSALVLLNICIIHFIYLFSSRGLVFDSYTVIVGFSLALLITGIWLKKKIILGTAVMAYPLIIILATL